MIKYNESDLHGLIDKIIIDPNELIYKINEKKFFINGYKFLKLGEGAFGIVFRVIGNGTDYILKVMKKKDMEPEKSLMLKEKINKLDKHQDLVNKYITKILDVKLNVPYEMILMEYLEGEDLSEFMEKEKNEQISEYSEENFFYIIITKIFLAVLVFHRILKYAHRDLKLGNLFFNSKDLTLKLIDFGFICNFNDYSCYNRYQGTSIYIHPNMNKKTMNNMYGGFKMRGINTKKNIRNNLIKNSKKLSSTSNNTEGQSFPKPRSQDIFSLIIIVFKLYTYINYDKLNKEEIQLDKSLSILFTHNKKVSNRRQRFELRYNKKYTFLKSLKKIDETKIYNKLISLLIKLIKDHWNFNESNFVKNGKDKSKKILNELVKLSLSQIQDKRLKEELSKDLSELHVK